MLYSMKILRRILMSILLLFFTSNCFSQNEHSLQKDSTDNGKYIFVNPEIRAKFPGGEDSLKHFLKSELNLDKLFLNVQGKVWVTFTIDTTGWVKDVKTRFKVTKRFGCANYDKLIEYEIKRTINAMPQWIPASMCNELIQESYTLPIKVCNKSTLKYWEVDKLAEFQYNGEQETQKSIEKYISKNIIWPSQDDCSGVVYVKVLINKKGVLSDFLVLQGLYACPRFNDEALRLVKNMPRWIPAKKNGKTVKSYHIIPIEFILR